jgi:geranylgeranyl pyrophosphate synthase
MGSPEQQTDADLTTAIEIMKRHQTFEESLMVARSFAALGAVQLASLPQNEITQLLRALIDYAVERDS